VEASRFGEGRYRDLRRSRRRLIFGRHRRKMGHRGDDPTEGLSAAARGALPDASGRVFIRSEVIVSKRARLGPAPRLSRPTLLAAKSAVVHRYEHLPQEWRRIKDAAWAAVITRTESEGLERPLKRGSSNLPKSTPMRCSKSQVSRSCEKNSLTRSTVVGWGYHRPSERWFREFPCIRCRVPRLRARRPEVIRLRRTSF
jgi:hypothetical protein